MSAAAPVRAWIGLGGNMGDVAAHFDAALALFADNPATRVVARSSNWRTPPWGDVDQPPFLNACIGLDVTLDPPALLELCLDIERQLGRNREAPGARRWGPRPIDIDLLDYDGLTLEAPGLSLPHPRLGQRAFALAPLAEIAPQLPVVVGDKEGALQWLPAAAALARLPQDGLERL